METALVQAQDSFIFRHLSFPLLDPRKDLVQNGSSTTLFNRPSFEEYPVLSNVSGDSGGSVKPQEEEEKDHSDAMLKYITQMLMEEDDLEKKPCMYHDCMAVQAAEKYFSNVLNGSEENNLIMDSSSSHLTSSSSDSIDESSPGFESPESLLQSLKSLSDGVSNGLQLDPHYDDSFLTSFHYSFGNDQLDQEGGEAANLFQSESNHSPSGSREKKNRHREDDDDAAAADPRRSNKQLAATFADESGTR